ncbi:hypothetical protein CR513_12859, partial [Mucuna pruriens]
MAEFQKVSIRFDSLMHQKARNKWVKKGDYNTKFFHSIVNWKMQTSAIKGKLGGGATKGQKENKNIFQNKFSDKPTQRPLLDEGNRKLTRFEEMEIKKVVRKCDGNKSPGLDGYNFRLMVVLGKIIDERPSAFIEGRNILDGVLVANEVVDKAEKVMFHFQS